MFLATAIVSATLAVLLVASACLKLSHRPRIVQSYARVGVPEHKLDLLAFVLLAGAAGLAVGLIWKPLGVAAAGALSCYFLVAIAFHVRARDLRHLAMPVLLELMALAALALHAAAR